MKYSLALAVVASLACSGVALAQDDNFDTPGTPAWTTDRYPPSTFQAGAVGGGRTGVLELGTNDTQGANDRPPGFGSGFYNTIGMQRLVDVGKVRTTIEMYTPDENWTTALDDRYGGYWTSTDAGYFFILELARVAGVDQWRAWDNGTWINTGATVDYDSWATLGVTLLSNLDKARYTVEGGSELLVNAYGSGEIAKLYVQTHNTDPNGLNRTVYYDNQRLSAAVPEPTTWALMILGFGGAGAMLRNRNRRLLAA